MLAAIYLLSCFYFGFHLMRYIFPDNRRLYMAIAPKKACFNNLPSLFFYLPAGFVIGTVLVSFLTYYLSLVASRFMSGNVHVLYPANILSVCLALYLGSLLWQKYVLITHPSPDDAMPKLRLGGGRSNRDGVRVPRPSFVSCAPRFSNKSLFFLFYLPILLLFAGLSVFLFYYSFYARENSLLAGFSVFSDFGPHTALVSSFSEGLNFPTDYPHFPSDGIRYHFLFYFLCGNLHLLGFPIAHALNIPSILFMVSAFVLLGTLAVLLSGRFSSFVLGLFLFFFRSSLAIVSQITHIIDDHGAHPQTIMTALINNTTWPGDTPYDEWGLWAINVYANQRHLALGLCVILLLIFFFLPHVRRMFLHLGRLQGARAKLESLFLSRQAWLLRKNDPLRPLAVGITAIALVVATPYFHGSALIYALLILFIFALFSENRLMYVLVAVAAISSAIIQTHLLSGGVQNVIRPSFHFGFVLAQPNLVNGAYYLLHVMGLALILAIALLFAQKRAYRLVFLSSLFVPIVFAFILQLTPEITANHKFIQFSIALFCIFIAPFLAFLFNPFSKPVEKPDLSASSMDSDITKKLKVGYGFRVTGRVTTRILSGLAAVILLISLTATGLSEWATYVRINRNHLTANLHAATNRWITENTAAKSIFLTAPYSYHTFFLSGRMAYYGHPYYAWSAGHDTPGREAIYRELITGCGGDVERFINLCREENIDYVYIDDTFRSISDPYDPFYQLNETFFFENFRASASFPDEGNTVIYRIR